MNWESFKDTILAFEIIQEGTSFKPMYICVWDLFDGLLTDTQKREFCKRYYRLADEYYN